MNKRNRSNPILLIRCIWERTRSIGHRSSDHSKVFFIHGAVVLLALLSSCSRPSVEATRDDSTRHQLVQTAQVRLCDAEKIHRFSGMAKEGRTVKMSFRVPGPLVEFPVEIGKRVNKGDFLAKIDPRDYELAIRQVEEGLKEANATLRAMKTGARAEDLASLEAAVAAADSRFQTAKRNEERFARLLESRSVSQIKYDEVKMLYDQAAAALEAAQQNLRKGQTGARTEEIEVMEAKIAGLTVQQEKARNALSDVSLYAPSDGYVSQKYVENGEIVAPGIPVLAFTDASEIRVQTTIPESLLLHQEEIVRFDCEFESYPGRKLIATLSELGLAQQAGKQGYPLEVAIAFDEDTVIHPGMAATVTVYLRKNDNEFLIPLSAIVGDDEHASRETENSVGKFSATQSEKSYVWCVNPSDGTLIKKHVELVRIVADGVVVTGELSPDDSIVSAGARFLRENEKVRVYQTTL